MAAGAEGKRFARAVLNNTARPRRGAGRCLKEHPEKNRKEGGDSLGGKVVRRSTEPRARAGPDARYMCALIRVCQRLPQPPWAVARGYPGGSAPALLLRRWARPSAPVSATPETFVVQTGRAQRAKVSAIGTLLRAPRKTLTKTLAKKNRASTNLARLRRALPNKSTRTRPRE